MLKNIRKKFKSKNLDAIKHGDKRKNIPTHELRDFVKEEEQSPKNMLYPRDSSLDPQLVWKGKDEQDQEELSVPVVPIYIQEKINPQAIIEDVRREAEKLPASSEGVQEETAPYSEQPDLFGDFNGLPEEFEQRVDFYKHDANWQNRMILGDSLMVMTSLAEKEGLKGQVQCIYIDPPYGIKFGSNWQVSTRKRDVKDGKAEDATRQPEQVRAFRDTWKLGIHSYLSYLRDRLVIARELLTETGSCFVQIGDENVHLVRCLMDEVFGSENFIGLINFSTTTGRGSIYLDSICDILLWYGKKYTNIKYSPLFLNRSKIMLDERYRYIQIFDGKELTLSQEQMMGIKDIPQGKRFRKSGLTSQGQTQGETSESFIWRNKKYSPSLGRHWSTGKMGLTRLDISNRITLEGKALVYKRFDDDYPLIPIHNMWNDTGGGALVSEKIYVVQTITKVIERCILMTTDPGDLVLDPTCGSGTTAYVAEQWGRRWITIDTSRVALALARTRIMSARYPSYQLADQYPEWTQFGADESSLKNYLRKHPPAIEKEKADIRKGFVYKRVPHITLKSIANNPDIKEGMSREQIDAAIAKHADTETLYDQPFEDSRSVRVAGPFTVESLSPHRVLPADENMDGNITEAEKEERGDFALMIIENLKKAGVQNTKKKERLKFETLEPFPGTWIQAKGTYGENGKSKSVAVSIGPEHGTVGPGQIKEAAKEAVKGLGHDLLIVCGFAFDPHVSEETKRYGALTVLTAKMNPDLSMGDELLKKTGAGNLFMVFGEPDVDVIKLADNKIAVKLLGVDVYDPTTGVIRSNSTDDVACWFIDTDYNGESFFVRHAYFTGGDEPYDKLKRALRSEINEQAWETLYQTESRAFDRPESGKIAVKVINHYGDEVLKIISV